MTLPTPGEVVTILNQPGTKDLQALVQTCFEAHELVCIGESWLGDDIRWAIVAKFERIYSAAATQIHAGLWSLQEDKNDV